MDRLGMLRTMAAAKPDDPFPTYGLAMELAKQGHNDDARATFAQLMERHPGYVPSYLMYGNLLGTMGHRDEAAAVLHAGIEVASAAGDDHARSELQAAADDLASGSGGSET